MKGNTTASASSLSLPPPYEASAYPTERTRGRTLLRSWASPRTLLSLALTLCVFWLCMTNRPVPHTFAGVVDDQFAKALKQCQTRQHVPTKPDPASRTANPRWGAEYGQKRRVVLKNATVFDGERFFEHAMDITFAKGLIESIKPSGQSHHENAVVYNLYGRYVTPGLVDMHSHHMIAPWPGTGMADDSAEVHADTKAVTGQMRIMDALKAYDEGTTLIASGGVTTSLIIPGSANLIGGEGAPVKNALYSGANAEPVVEEVLLERGIPQSERRRYMKMALGENPKAVWGYSRLGNAWHLREHFQKAKELMQSQDDYCVGLEAVQKKTTEAQSLFLIDNGRFPFNLELESIIALLRGQVSLHNHNYEPEDLETMIRISEEFGYRISGFHHAIEAWQVAGMLQERVPNITIATFAEFSLYKHESYWPSLYAGHILDQSGIKVAYKSDHVATFTNAKYLLSQAAVAHAFHLPAEKALQAVTSVPAAAIEQDHRVGYCKAGYDADIVVWDDHPLNRGATALQVFIDGIAQLNDTMVEKSTGSLWNSVSTTRSAKGTEIQVKYEPEERVRDGICQRVTGANGNIVISGITRVFLDKHTKSTVLNASEESGKLEMVLKDGEIVCAGTLKECQNHRDEVETRHGYAALELSNGHIAPGISALTNSLGVREIATDPDTGDGNASGQDIADPESVTYAKYAASLDGKSFARARLGGITRAITAPVSDGPAFVQGVSVEILTSGKRSLLHGGIVQEDVALHVQLGVGAISDEGTGSNGIKKLRKMLSDGLGKNNETVYGRVASGHLPLLVYAENKYEVEQLIWVKKDFPDTKVVLVGAMEAPFVAKDLAAAGIPVILTRDRGAPTSFRTKDGFVGPPLTRSIASYLKEAGVTFGLALIETDMPADFKIHDLLPEAGWTAKYANLTDSEAVKLVTSNIEEILNLNQESNDVVVYEGDPLHYGATVAITLVSNDETGKLEVVNCFPRENEVIVSTSSVE
ncbi:hypothetical protein NLG97_g397 [Lecanicillium saksenae]|uniref:Uncharacterized protein n=1 Tax=Lecanicillium saksenae TaxID=468837 RepID=A0ACC1R9C3_9HYPO|nr:hypothetical protein NLG97_g397 [Lecanicillium saksenae]